MQDNRVKVSPKAILEFLADGKTREEIREHYGLSKSDMKRVFEHPELKGRKTKKAPGFVFEEESTNEEISNRENEQDSTDSTETQPEEQNLQSDVADSPSQWRN